MEIDLKEFKKQQEQVKQYATQGVAQRIEQVKELLKEIKELALLGNVQVQLGGGYGELSSAIADVDEANPNWNSSSYDC